MSDPETNDPPSQNAATGAAEVPAFAGDGVERRDCRLCGKPIAIVRDSRTGKKVALDVSTVIHAAVRTVRGPWCYDAGAWLAAARALAPEESYEAHLRDTLRFFVDHSAVCEGLRKDAKPGT